MNLIAQLLAVIGLLTVLVPNASGYLAGEPIEFKREVVINFSDGSTRIACDKNLILDRSQTEAWYLKLTRAAGEQNERGDTAPEGWMIACEEVVVANSTAHDPIETEEMSLEFRGSMVITIDAQMQGERVIRVRSTAIQWPQSEDENTARAAAPGDWPKRSVVFFDDSFASIPLWMDHAMQKKGSKPTDIFLRLSAREMKRPEDSQFGALWIDIDDPQAQFRLDGMLLSRPEDSPAWLIFPVPAGIHFLERMTPTSAAQSGWFVRVHAGLTTVAQLPESGATRNNYALEPLGKNSQGFDEYRRQRDRGVVIQIPEGKFLMGNMLTERSPLEHEVYVSEFLIDKTGVSWAQYKQFAAATGRPLPPHDPYWGIKDDEPAVFVTWEDSKAYCEWAGARLPTEAEREKAARGTDGRMFPWGEAEPTPELAVFRRSWGYDGPDPVASHVTGASPYGALNMGGNVWEWCSDWYDDHYYEQSPDRDPKGPETGIAHVIRGGSWDSRPAVLSASCRNWGAIGYREGDFGFRCAMDSPLVLRHDD